VTVRLKQLSCHHCSFVVPAGGGVETCSLHPPVDPLRAASHALQLKNLLELVQQLAPLPG